MIAGIFMAPWLTHVSVRHLTTESSARKDGKEVMALVSSSFLSNPISSSSIR